MRIHYKLTFFERIIKGSLPSRREIIPHGNLDLYREAQSTKTSKSITKYIDLLLFK